MKKLFVVFSFDRIGGGGSGQANAFVQVPKIDEENIRALELTIRRANPNQFDQVCVVNFIEVKE